MRIMKSLENSIVSLFEGMDLSFTAVVVGYGNGYYSCTYQLNEDGWCGYCDYYEEEN